MNEKMENKRKITKAERDAYALVGSHGGKATFKKRGRKHMSQIGKIGAEKRWAKIKNNS